MTDMSLDFVPNKSAHGIISLIIKSLFGPESNRLDKEITELNRLNQFKGGTPADGFMYEGEYFRPSNIPRGKTVKVQLHEDFHPRMVVYLADRKIIEDDLGWLKQILFKLLDPCESFQDLRDALPDCLSDTLPSLSNLYRTRPEAYTVLNDPRTMKQYGGLRSKLELYSVSKLFY